MAIYVNFEGLESAENELNQINQKVYEEMTLLEELITQTTDNDWKGSDAQLFVSTSQEKVSKVKEEYNDYIASLKEEIALDRMKFQDVQTHNMGMID